MYSCNSLWCATQSHCKTEAVCNLFLHTTVNKTVHLTDQERFVVSYFRATFRQIEKVEEQMQSLTAYQLNKTSRKPETTARYQYLQAIFPQVMHTLFENPRSTISHRSVFNSRLNCGETLQQTPITKLHSFSGMYQTWRQDPNDPCEFDTLDTIAKIMMIPLLLLGRQSEWKLWFHF